MAPFAQKRLPAFRDENEPYTTGRPTDYRPEYCELVISEMSKGISLGAFAGTIGVSRETVYKWRTERREFSDAVARARAAQQLWWELKLGRSRKGAETTASIFVLKNIAPDQWRDLKYTEHTHTVRAEMLTDQQLNAIAAGAVPSDVGVNGVIEGECERIEPDPETG
jgi:hypothetical protein